MVDGLAQGILSSMLITSGAFAIEFGRVAIITSTNIEVFIPGEAMLS